MEEFISKSHEFFRQLQENNAQNFGHVNSEEGQHFAAKAKQILNRLACVNGLQNVFEQFTTMRPGADLAKLNECHHQKLDQLIDKLEDEKKAAAANATPAAQNSLARRRKNEAKDISKFKPKKERRELHVEKRDKHLYTVVKDPLSIELSLLRTRLYHIVSVEHLARLAATFCEINEFAFDFELTCFLHPGHPRQQRVCLLQISTDTMDFLVDVLVAEVHENIRHFLAHAFADGHITKVCHGNQEHSFLKQLGILDVKAMVDTSGSGRLNLRALVYEACGVWLDKTMRTADWTQRPLTEGMIDYARCDTHYLLRCYHYLKDNGRL